MSPEGGEMPSELKDAFEESFGSVDKGLEHFVAATKAVEGSGWGILAFEPFSQKLVVLQSEKHQNLAIWSAVPLFVCDVWEHAYYLKYQNKRAQWVDNFMKIANWKFAAEQLMQAKKVHSC
jgi:superoxide dismutase, Fe-Mn family